MKSKPIVWLQQDEKENFQLYGVNFSQANEVINNDLTLKIKNLHGDFILLASLMI